jgi:hypothetical protein
MKQPRIVSRQSTCIIAVLDVAKRDLLVQFTPIGVRVETESLPGQDGIACSGSSLRDALGQVTQVLALELGLDVDAIVDGAAWLHDDPTDADAPIGYVPELPVEFCTRFVTIDEVGAEMEVG